MLADDGSEPSNGTFRVVSNGSRARGQEELAGATSNGTHKPASESANGSSQNGKEGAAVPETTYLGHDREEVTRILIQALTDMGYHAAAQSVSRDSGFQLESPTVAAFRTAVLEGKWTHAEELLSGATTAGHGQQTGNGLVLAPGADRNMMRIWVRQQKYLELLERRETPRALTVLRNELTPLCQEQQTKLHFLSSLLMCQSPTDLKFKADWDGAVGQSRHILLSELSRCISPSVMLPEHRLAVLLEQVKENQISNCLYHTSAQSPSLCADHLCDRSQFPSEVLFELEKHSNEVWQVCFSHDGTRLASCGQDRHVLIWDVPSFETIYSLDCEDGVGNLAWSPDDTMLITCGRDRHAKIWNMETGTLFTELERFDEPVSCCVWAADSLTFVVGSFDKERSLCQYNSNGEKISTWTKKHRTEDLAVSPDGHWLVAMDDQSKLHVYNFVTRDLEYEMELKARPTSLSISQDSRYLLVNKTDGEGQLIEIATREPVQKYSGAVGGEYLIRSTFGGANENFVISGSEDGAICVWHKAMGILVEKLDAHQPRCNAVSWNPADPCMFASCGDDNRIKIWSNKERVRSVEYKLRHSNGASQGSNGWGRIASEQPGEV